MQRLQYILIGLVVVLVAAVAYGYISGEDDDGSGEKSTSAQVSPEAEQGKPQPGSGAGSGKPDAAPEAKGGGGGNGKQAAGSGGGGKPKADGASKEKSDGAGDGDGEGAKKSGGGTGDGNEADSGGSAAPSRTVVIRKGNKICALVPKRLADRLSSLEKEARAEGGPPDLEAIYGRAATPTLNEAARKFEALDPPAGDAGRLAALAAALEKAARVAAETPLSELQGEKEPLADFKKLASAYGLTVCTRL